MGSDTALDGLLKDVYLPGLTNTVYDDPSFMGLIAQGFGEVDATGRQLIHAFETQRAGGYGSFAEGGNFKNNVPIDGFQAVEWIKYMNLYFELTGPAMATVVEGEGAYVDIVERHVSSIARTAKNQAERMFTGQGNAKLCTLNAEPADATGADAANRMVLVVDGVAFFDTQFVQKGIEFQVVNPVVTTPTVRSSDGTAVGTDATTLFTVNDFTKGSKRTSTNGTITLPIGVAYDTNGTMAANDIVCLKESYAAAVPQGMASGNKCLEPNGLDNLVSDGKSNSETGNEFAYSWNTLRYHASSAYNEELQSHMYDAANQELDEEMLLESIMENSAIHQGNPNLLMVSARAMLKYFLNSKEDRRFNTMDAMAWTGGYSGMGIQLGSKKLMLTTVNSAPTGKGFLINTNDFMFLRPPGMSGFKWLTGEAGGVMTQKQGYDSQFASAVDYVQMVCFDPGRQTKIFDIAE
jgi:hypothetical protein